MGERIVMGVKIPAPLAAHGKGLLYDVLTREQTKALDAAGEYYMAALDENDPDVKRELEHLRDMERARAAPPVLPQPASPAPQAALSAAAEAAAAVKSDDPKPDDPLAPPEPPSPASPATQAAIFEQDVAEALEDEAEAAVKSENSEPNDTHVPLEPPRSGVFAV